MNYKKIQIFQMNTNYLDMTLCSLLLHVKMFNQSETICSLKQCSKLAFITTTNSIYERKLTLIVVKFNVLPFISMLKRICFDRQNFQKMVCLLQLCLLYQTEKQHDSFIFFRRKKMTRLLSNMTDDSLNSILIKTPPPPKKKSPPILEFQCFDLLHCTT